MQDSWLIDGDCTICRKEKYCNKECKLHRINRKSYLCETMIREVRKCTKEAELYEKTNGGMKVIMDEKKVREAIKYFTEIREKLSSRYVFLREESVGQDIDILNTTIEALEKQLPKKPIDKSCVKDNDTIYGYVGICPSCNNIVDDSMIVCDCTQVLDWSE